ncbi:hypothetical protein E6O75_ATG01347 [Venturia nashicola]|uniref:Uncharacterized protein n=1 Tax=Venturia nashicola TaxID=86259 RepID=A0A4Z1PGQ3_9PEZI|nr:hypothetical protein E6O75_ATG01347 [Venturia nashicola]
MDEKADYPLYASTFTLYRSSPLYHGSNPLFTNLDVHARHLRETLIRDSSREARLPELYPGANTSGSLESCEWRLIGDEESWMSAQEEAVNGQVLVTHPSEARGIQIELKFEKARHMAMLMRDQSQISNSPGFTSLPLFLIRMPAPLRDIFVDFLTTTFDARISPMPLRPSFLTATVEQILDKTSAPDDEDPSFSLDSISKGIGIQLSFPSAAPLLKSIDVSIPKDDIREFLARGRRLWQQYQTQRRANAQLSIGPQSPITGPFSAALSTYLSNHISMKLDNPGVSVSKIAIGPFALAGEGKVKVLFSSSPAVEFWESLITEARGTGLEGPAVKRMQDASMEDVTMEEEEEDGMILPREARRRAKLTRDSLPSEPPPPYELHDPTTA